MGWQFFMDIKEINLIWRSRRVDVIHHCKYCCYLRPGATLGATTTLQQSHSIILPKLSLLTPLHNLCQLKIISRCFRKSFFHFRTNFVNICKLLIGLISLKGQTAGIFEWNVPGRHQIILSIYMDPIFIIIYHFKNQY